MRTGECLHGVSNEFGQLGIRDDKDRDLPTLVTGLLQTKTAVQVAAGDGHTACLTADGLVVVCGYWNMHHQSTTYTQVGGELATRKVVQVVAGGGHTVCVAII